MLECPRALSVSGAALVLNLGVEYAIARAGAGGALADSLSGAPAEAAAAYLTIIAWRSALAALGPPPGP